MYPDVNRRRFRKGEKEIRIVARRWMPPLWAIVKRTLRRQSPVAIATSQEPCDGWIIVWEKFLFSSSPLPPSLPLTCSHFHSSPGPVCWMLASYRIFLDLIRPSFSFSLSCFVFVCCEIWIATWRRLPDNCCHNCALLFGRVRAVWELYLRAWTAMCSKGTVSARDSFVYISEAVLSNHGAAPETTRPENMQCLTVSETKPSHPLCVCIV